MQRPSSRKIQKYNLIEKFREKGINAIFCLQEPGEHPRCGDGIQKLSGLSYLPEEFYEHKIQFYNFGWRDHETTDVVTLVKIIKTMDLALGKDQKVAVHCHAGRGRTGLVICGYLMFKNQWNTEYAVTYFQQRRKNSLNRQSQIDTLKQLEEFIKDQSKIYFRNITYFNIIQQEKMISFQSLDHENKNNISNAFFNDNKIHIPKLFKYFLKKLYRLTQQYPTDDVLRCIYSKPEFCDNYEEIKFKIQNENKIEEFYKAELNGSEIMGFMHEFFVHLKGALLDKKTMQTLRFLLDNHFDFEDAFVKKHKFIEKNINNNEIAILIELYNFYNKIGEYSESKFEKSLFMFALFFLDYLDDFNLYFQNQKLKKHQWNNDIHLSTFRKFFQVLRKSEFECEILQSNIDIFNSPLKSFSINKKNKSILTIKSQQNSEKSMLQSQLSDFNKEIKEFEKENKLSFQQILYKLKLQFFIFSQKNFYQYFQNNINQNQYIIYDKDKLSRITINEKKERFSA